MKQDRRPNWPLAALLFWVAASVALTAVAARADVSGPVRVSGSEIEPDAIVELWPLGPPGERPVGLEQHVVHRTNQFGLPDRALHDVTVPALAVFRPIRPNGGAILIAPGGGYAWVVVDKEGYESAVQFALQGYTVYVLRYRLPHQGWQAGSDAPLEDIQRAVRVIRAGGLQDGARPTAVLALGFSAGGHLTGSLASRASERLHDPVDAIDEMDARPDLVGLMYPVVTMELPFAHRRSRENLIGANPLPEAVRAASLEQIAHPGQPPAFLLHAADDQAVPVEHTLMLFRALQTARVPTSLHVFERGGHGFGVRGIDGTPLEVWPSLLIDWAVDKGFPAPIAQE
jgi:acetyl esterase/lipase